MKPHKGFMENWRRQDFKDGYIYRGRFVNHPEYGFTDSFASTSKVLSEAQQADGSIEIETVNSRYTLTPARSSPRANLS